MGAGDLAFGHVMPRSLHLGDYRAYAPSYPEVLDALFGSGVPLAGFPLCVAARVRGPHAPSAPRRATDEPEEPAEASQPFEARAKPELCRACAWEPRCPGSFESHLAAYGESGLEAQT